MSSAPLPGRRGQTSRDIYRAVFDAEHPEQFVRTVPAQSLYLVIKQRGLPSAGDLVDLVTTDQMRLFLDFDLWEHGQFKEENVWEWLALSDDDDQVRFTQKFLKAVDLKIVSILVSRYVLVKVFDEPTEKPPSAGWHTPDKGYTWLSVNTEDSTKYFHLNRLLALLFETSAELFYQILSIPTVSTESVLEEESLQDRTRRLASEGMPEFSLIEELNSSLFPFEARALIEERKVHAGVSDIAAVEPLLYDGSSALEPLQTAVRSVKDFEAFEAELTLVMNASLEFFNIPVHEYDAVISHTARVRGAINVGLEKACTSASCSPDAAMAALGVAKLYRLGLHELRALRKEALKVTTDEAKLLMEDQRIFSAVACARQPFPEMPEFLNETSGEEDPERPRSSARAITSLTEIQQLLSQLPRPAA